VIFFHARFAIGRIAAARGSFHACTVQGS